MFDASGGQHGTLLCCRVMMLDASIQDSIDDRCHASCHAHPPCVGLAGRTAVTMRRGGFSCHAIAGAIVGAIAVSLAVASVAAQEGS